MNTILHSPVAENNLEISANNRHLKIEHKPAVNPHYFNCKKTIFNSANADALFAMFTADVINKQKF